MNLIRLMLFSAALLAVGCQTMTKAEDDQFVWLEEVEGKKQLDWVQGKNKQTLSFVEADKRFEPVKQDLIDIYTADDRIPMPKYDGQYVHNFWRDKKNVRGIWRRTSRISYRKKSPKWETVLDIDKLSEDEKENWVYKGSTCLPPKFQRCLLRLSRGGTDASVIREFDTKTKLFVENGFVIPQAKSNYSWYDEDHILVGTDFGEGSLTDSGYPAMVKVWKRGTPLKDAKLVFKGDKKDVSSSTSVFHSPEGRFAVISKYESFYSSKKYRIKDNFELEELPLPENAEISDVYKNNLIITLRKSWKNFKSGSVLSASLDYPDKAGSFESIDLLYEPTKTSTVNYITRSSSGLFFNLSENVMGKVLFVRLSGASWKTSTLKFPKAGVISNISTNPYTDVTYFSYESFTQPRALFELTTPLSTPVKRKSQPERFDGSKFATQQFFATSKDGTKVPYFVVHKKGLKFDGSHPTLQYGYGGFEISMNVSHHSARQSSAKASPSALMAASLQLNSSSQQVKMAPRSPILWCIKKGSSLTAHIQRFNTAMVGLKFQ
jgi:prolyl oligopeptidase